MDAVFAGRKFLTFHENIPGAGNSGVFICSGPPGERFFLGVFVAGRQPVGHEFAPDFSSFDSGTAKIDGDIGIDPLSFAWWRPSG